MFSALGRIDEVDVLRSRETWQTGSSKSRRSPWPEPHAPPTQQSPPRRRRASTLPTDCAKRPSGALTRALDGMSDDWSSTLPASEALRAQALARSLDGGPAVPEWRAAAAAAATHGDYRALRPRLGLACALLESGDRTEAREVLLDVWQSARRMGARGVESEAAKVARRSRIALPGLEELPPRLAALTPREREVLGLLATGATNRDIADRLVISEKTASVHVSRILNKLGVNNRGSAAALVRDLTG